MNQQFYIFALSIIIRKATYFPPRQCGIFIDNNRPGVIALVAVEVSLRAFGHAGVLFYVQHNRKEGIMPISSSVLPHKKETIERRLAYCVDEIHPIIDLLGTLTRSIQTNEEDYYKSDIWLLMVMQRELAHISTQIELVHQEIIKRGVL